MKTTRVWIGLILVSLIATPVDAAIVGGTVTIIPPPLNTGNDNQQINQLLGFDEQQNVVLTTDVVVDKPAGIIPAGTVVSSHYVIYDPPSTASKTATVIVDQTVLGVIYNATTLNNSDYLGLPTTNYLNPSGRGFEVVDGDSATIVDSVTVSFHLSAGSPGDYARIITASTSTISGPQFLMRTPSVPAGDVHTNTDGIGSVRLLFDQPINFDSEDISVRNENDQIVVAYATGSGSPFMIITFSQNLWADRYTITVHDTVVSSGTGSRIDGDHDGNAGGDLVFTMEHRKRMDGDNDNHIGLEDLAKLAQEWLWAK